MGEPPATRNGVRPTHHPATPLHRDSEAP
jgi:hypothetical protein